jgi:hypothetical protein
MKIASLNNAAIAIERGFNDSRRAAHEIATANNVGDDRPHDITGPLVALGQAKHQVEAAAKVVQAVDDMLGALLE